MPNPGLSGGFGSEVRLTIVVDLGREPEEPAIGVGWGGTSSGAQAILLIGTL